MLLNQKLVKISLVDLNSLMVVDQVDRVLVVIEVALTIEEASIIEVIQDLEITQEEGFKVSHNSTSKNNDNK